LGYLIGAYVVQRNSRGELTLLHQQLTTKTIDEFARGLEPSDIELVKLRQVTEIIHHLNFDIWR
jgi:hypothetical protein